MLIPGAILTLIVTISIIHVLYSRLPKTMLRRALDTEGENRGKLAAKYAIRVGKILGRLKEALSMAMAESLRYSGTVVIPVIAILLLLCGFAGEAADVPLQYSFWRGTLPQESIPVIWFVTFMTIALFSGVPLVAIIVAALWTGMRKFYIRFSIGLAILCGALVIISAAMLGGVKFLSVTEFEQLQGTLFWCQICLTEFLPLAGAGIHAAALLYDRPRHIQKKIERLQIQINEIEQIHTQLLELAKPKLVPQLVQA